MSPGDGLDLRWTELDEELFNRILHAVRDARTGVPQIRALWLVGASISGDLSLDSAEIGGDVWANDAQISGRTLLRGAKIAGNAWFGNAKLGGEVEFAGAVIGGNVTFEDVQFGSHINFECAEIGGDVRSRRSKIGGHVLFDRVEISGGVTFAAAEIDGKVDFPGAKIGHDLWFGGAKIGSKANFGFAEIGGDTDFAGTKIGGEASFNIAEIKGEARFRGALFTGDARFSRTSFYGDVFFTWVRVDGSMQIGPSLIGGLMDLSSARVSGDLRLEIGAKRLRCADSSFGGRVWLSLRGGEVSVTNSVFMEPVTVESSLAPIRPFRPVAEVLSDREETRTQVLLRSLRGTDAEHLTLVDVDLGQCVLSGLRRPELLRLEGQCVFARAPRGWFLRWGWLPWRWLGREALFEEHLWRQSVGAQGWMAPERLDQVRSEEIVGPARLAVLYRQLRRAVENAGNEAGASGLYYGEMEMRRLGATRRPDLGLLSERWLLGAYWLVSGYGLRAGRALAWLAALAFVAALALGHGGFVGASPDFPGRFLYAAGSVVSLNVMVQHVPEVLTGWGGVIRLVLRVGGPILLGLAALAVRAQVKR